ncbi:MAG TPA: hypothetical protein VII22_28190 [Streptosporangiaceae bacterium]
MAPDLPDNCRELLELQRGVLARWQAPAVGLDPSVIDGALRRGRWRPLYRGVYAAFTGDPAREAVLWAAVLRAGPGAALSHYSAAELDRLTDRPASLIHVTIDSTRKLAMRTHERSDLAPGIVVHRSGRVNAARHPSRTPPRTRIEETTLDLTQISADAESAFSWISRACGSRLTTPHLLRVALESRSRLRWRAELTGSLTEAGAGVHSVLEHRYVRAVERPHRLPVAQRQARIALGGRTRYLDNFYQEFLVAVELDGQAAHPVAERWRDISGDNASSGVGVSTLRYSWADVTQRPCALAGQIASVLRLRGWTGRPHACGPRCSVAAS